MHKIPASRQAGPPPNLPGTVIMKVKLPLFLKNDRLPRPHLIATSRTIPVPDHHPVVPRREPQRGHRPPISILLHPETGLGTRPKENHGSKRDSRTSAPAAMFQA